MEAYNYRYGIPNQAKIDEVIKNPVTLMLNGSFAMFSLDLD